MFKLRNNIFLSMILFLLIGNSLSCPPKWRCATKGIGVAADLCAGAGDPREAADEEVRLAEEARLLPDYIHPVSIQGVLQQFIENHMMFFKTLINATGNKLIGESHRNEAVQLLYNNISEFLQNLQCCHIEALEEAFRDSLMKAIIAKNADTYYFLCFIARTGTGTDNFFGRILNQLLYRSGGTQFQFYFPPFQSHQIFGPYSGQRLLVLPNASPSSVKPEIIDSPSNGAGVPLGDAKFTSESSSAAFDSTGGVVVQGVFKTLLGVDRLIPDFEFISLSRVLKALEQEKLAEEARLAEEKARAELAGKEKDADAQVGLAAQRRKQAEEAEAKRLAEEKARAEKEREGAAVVRLAAQQGKSAEEEAEIAIKAKRDKEAKENDALCKQALSKQADTLIAEQATGSKFSPPSNSRFIGTGSVSGFGVEPRPEIGSRAGFNSGEGCGSQFRTGSQYVQPVEGALQAHDMELPALDGTKDNSASTDGVTGLQVAAIGSVLLLATSALAVVGRCTEVGKRTVLSTKSFVKKIKARMFGKAKAKSSLAKKQLDLTKKQVGLAKN